MQRDTLAGFSHSEADKEGEGTHPGEELEHQALH
jgi:hypothetical protein